MDRHRVLAEGSRDHVAESVSADLRDGDTFHTVATAWLDVAELADARIRASDQRQVTIRECWSSERVLRGDTLVDKPVSTCQPTWQGLDLVQP